MILLPAGLSLAIPAGSRALGTKADGRWEACRAVASTDPRKSECIYRLARAQDRRDEGVVLLDGWLRRQPGDPDLAFNLARLELDQGIASRAIELFDIAASGFAARGDVRLEAYARLNRANCLQAFGRLDEAETELESAESAAEGLQEPSLVTHVGIARARLLRRKGELSAAYAILIRAQRRLEASDAAYGLWKDLLLEMGDALNELGRPAEAENTAERWAVLAHQAGDATGEAIARADRAAYSVQRPPRLGAREAALALAREAVEAAVRSGQRAAWAKAEELLGRLRGGPEGREHLEDCLALSGATENPRQRVLCLFALAASQVEEQPQQALRTLTEASALGAESDEPWTVVYPWSERFRVTWAALPREQAIADSLAFLDLLESLRLLQEAEADRTHFFAAWTEVYDSLAGRLLSTGSASGHGASTHVLATALSVAERMRARVLYDSLRRVGAAGPETDAAPTGERTTVLRRIVEVQRRLQLPSLSRSERTELVTRLDRLEQDLAQIERRAAQTAPTPLPRAGFVTQQELEKTLAPDEALLTFQIGLDRDIFGGFAGGSWLLVSTGRGTRAYRLPGRLDLESRVQVFLGLIPSADETELAFAAAALYRVLLEPALAVLSPRVRRLTVVPDGILHLLPFGLLRAYPQAEPLATRFRLSVAPSATLWHLWRQQAPASSEASVLALADPAFLGDRAGTDPGTDPADARGSVLESGAVLGRLPYARREGRSVMRYLGGPDSQLMAGEDASETAFKKLPLGTFRVIHFAVHALLDERRPERSAILLAAGSAREDGLLQPREIAALPLSGSLVVLSACSSASGQVILGEGVQSLARAFFQAGARAVVGALWRMRDDDAAAFFDAFYRALGAGRSVAEAIATAQQERRRAGAPATAWAGFVVLGDGDLVPLPGGAAHHGWSDPIVLLSALALLALVALAIGALRRSG